MRRKVEQFCVARALRIVDAIEPRRIVAIGFKTLKLFGEPTTPGIAGAKQVLTLIGEIGGRDTIAMRHLTGARISVEDRKRIADSVLVN